MNGLDERIERIFSENNIEYVSACPFELCSVINPRAEGRIGFIPRSVIIFAVPYFAGTASGNISLYAVSEDYHYYFKELFGVLIPHLAQLFPTRRFRGFSDSSPIDEVKCALYARLGVLGDNSMLINEKYSSFVFLGEILTDIEYDKISTFGEWRIEHCEGCGECKRACPSKKHGLECLSSLTQKKGILDEASERLITDRGMAWGCDMCQLACPHTKKMLKEKIVTPIEFFHKNRIECLTTQRLDGMGEDEFSRRAYSWRGRAVIARNLRLLGQ